jgi:hypothetical protein
MEIIKDIRDNLAAMVNEVGCSLFYGGRNAYNQKKIISNKEVILEVFDTKPLVRGVCKFETSLTFWVALRQETTAVYQDADGREVEQHDKTLQLANDVIAALYRNEKLQPTQSRHTLTLEYFPADASATVNSQSLIRFVFPCYVMI